MFYPKQQIGPYTLVLLLGQGGFGEVWLAEKRGLLLTSQVALKLPLDPNPDLNAIRHEAQVWLQASGHPNVLPVIDADIYSGQVAIISEYAAGGSLAFWLKQNGGKAPSVESAIAMTSGILAGLEYLHALKPEPIIHRDLKPDNVLLQGGLPRLTDFGISRVLKTTGMTQNASGTPHYMPPEAFGGKYSSQSDLWAAGVIMYQMLTGKLPFPQSDLPSLYGAILTGAPTPLPADVPTPLRITVMKALEKDLARRPQSAGAMRILLNQPLVPSTPVFPPAKFKKNPKDDADMVFIPAGEFTMGSNDVDSEKPIHKVMLDGYYIYRTPVTVAQYKRFIASHYASSNHISMPPAPDFNPNWSKLDHPIVNVSYNDALAYCEWAGVKLPTEAQWEKAARGTDGRIYPWGNDFDTSKLQYSKYSYSNSQSRDWRGTKPVGSFPSGASPFGVLDMAGNVWQWCSDWHDPDFYSNPLATKRNPENQSLGEKRYRVLRCGPLSYAGPYDFRSAFRTGFGPDNGDDDIGFRCVSGL